MKKLSIIVPVYNVEKYLPKCIESIMAQTYRKFELILVDDGSPDKSGSICDEYATKDSRIIVIHKANGGVSAARNSGLQIASGEYIGFVDPDDYIARNMYENMIKELEEHSVDMVICGYDYINEDYSIDRKYKEKEMEILTQEEIMSMQFDMPPTIRHTVMNKIFRKEDLSNIFFLEKYHSSEDVDFLIRYLKGINKAVFIHKPYYKNLVRKGSATHGGLKITDLAMSFEVHEKMHLESIRLYPSLKHHSLAFLLDVFLLKYNESKRKLELLSAEERKLVTSELKYMRKMIRKYAKQALLCREIYWKTRICYCLCK